MTGPETRLKEHWDACKRGMMEKSAVADDTLRGVLQPRWRTGSPWLLDRCDEEAGREEQSSPTLCMAIVCTPSLSP